MSPRSVKSHYQGESTIHVQDTLQSIRPNEQSRHRKNRGYYQQDCYQEVQETLNYRPFQWRHHSKRLFIFDKKHINNFNFVKSPR